MSCKILLSLIGTAAGAINGLFGAGGGMVLVPLLGAKVGLSENERFPASVAIMAPVCIIALLFSGLNNLTYHQALPYLFGSAIGGTAAGLWGHKIPTVWLHRFLGGIILWGGIRFLC